MVKLDSKGGFLKKGRNKEEKKDAYKKPRTQHQKQGLSGLFRCRTRELRRERPS